MQWTIIRPGGLKSEPATGSGILTEDRSICGAINREDVAELVVKALFSDKSDGKVGPDIPATACRPAALISPAVNLHSEGSLKIVGFINDVLCDSLIQSAIFKDAHI